MSRNIWAAIACLALLVVIAFISATDIGFSVTERAVESVKRADVLWVQDDDSPYYGGPSVPVLTWAFENGVIPRQKVLPFVSACVIDRASLRGSNVGTRWQAMQATELDSETVVEGYVELGLGSKTVELLVERFVYYKPRPFDGEPVPVKPVPVVEESYDALVLFLDESAGGLEGPSYVDCYNLQESDLVRARVIPIVEG